MASFFSERTAEYSLIPAVIGVLAKNNSRIVPIYFWRTREGNNISLAQNLSGRVKVLAMFARRPKLCGKNGYVSGKVNKNILRYALHARKYGVATISGFISVDSIMNLSNEDSYVWFDLSNSKHPINDAEFFCRANSNEILEMNEFCSDINIINKDDIPCLIDAICKPLIWQECIEVISELNKITYSDNNGYFGRFLGGGYRPVYFLILE
ncbi:hypothetical protein GRAQ_02977 [Rahnella aquatilis CIP 78.65 = ATCC 33071]|uniref:Uncharacterized protein n=1 Tax=Rahnella aquatilis (strain ATCC 33071 / DSM 4594 / JCM 1683 / NBRC 105701 / NCIMB 13365 / CIP 78.65) TaxID=745277 RepID=H2ISP6_RAHAC|nr:hypothetical protein [Rahnella aquatilis]AEX53750.1 hypothetical protein Rahaq2_3976 [Rahnella aquatilis CIP 78.65 = ATCC 33071]KFD02556.1 hypothetical protein GRAQ_02977 [Rahnella aquatilis CIP 78.65 = ATCC 33071]